MDPDNLLDICLESTEREVTFVTHSRIGLEDCVSKLGVSSALESP